MDSSEDHNKTFILRFGNVDFQLVEGDIFFVDADAIICQVDQKLQTEEGLFGILKRKNAFSKNILTEINKLPSGQAKLIKCSGTKVPNVILASVISPVGLVDRAIISSALTHALELADAQHFRVLATPLLGMALAQSNYEVTCGVMMKSAREFGSKNKGNLKKIILSIYNPQAYASCQNVFFAFQQSLGPQS